MSFRDTSLEGSFEHPVVKTDDQLIALASAMLNAKTSILKKHGISFQQYIILKTLHFAKGEPASIKLLTKEMFDKMSNTSRLVAKLEKKGFVERKVSDADRRQVEIKLSEEGQRIFIGAARELNQAILKAYKPLTEEELNNFFNILLKLKKLQLD